MTKQLFPFIFNPLPSKSTTYPSQLKIEMVTFEKFDSSRSKLVKLIFWVIQKQAKRAAEFCFFSGVFDRLLSESMLCLQYHQLG